MLLLSILPLPFPCSHLLHFSYLHIYNGRSYIPSSLDNYSQILYSLPFPLAPTFNRRSHGPSSPLLSPAIRRALRLLRAVSHPLLDAIRGCNRRPTYRCTRKPGATLLPTFAALSSTWPSTFSATTALWHLSQSVTTSIAKALVLQSRPLCVSPHPHTS